MTPTSRLRLPFVLSLLSLNLFACGKHQSSASEPDFAYFPPASSYGGPLGRLEALRLGFPTNFADLKICVETGKEKITDDQIVFETKLAYAAWLGASNSYSEEDWQRFQFIGQAKCKSDDASYAGFVMLADLSKLEAGEQLTGPFQEQQLTCSTNGSWKSCQGNGITLGWGGPGSLTAWYLGTPTKWTKLETYRSSTTTLSPYVSWLSLPEDITRSKAANMTDAKKQALIATYNQLKATAAPTMADLNAFVAQLAAAELTTADDQVFASLTKQFYAGHTPTLSQTYRGERGAFSTVLHEVGHQYGMDHAHHPGVDSITGKSATATQNATGQWVTDIASMAYGLPYLYLTDDDQAGIQADVKAVRDYLASHK